MLIFLLLIIIICLLFILRNSYTFSCASKATIIIHQYAIHLIDKGQYDMKTNYYDKMNIGYVKYLFSIWLWGADKYIKPEYREVLKSFKNDLKKTGKHGGYYGKLYK